MLRENGYGSSNEGEYESIYVGDGYLRRRKYRGLRGFFRGNRYRYGDRGYY